MNTGTDREIGAPPGPPGKRVPRVGMVMAFTGHYRSAHLIARFLEEAGARVIRSRVTTPAVTAVASGVASADLCLPLRTYIGHVHALIEAHPDLDYIVMPIVLSEDGKASTCTKYRDLGGATIRSLGSAVGYTLARTPGLLAAAVARLTGSARVRYLRDTTRQLPTILEPEIRVLSREHLLPVCFDLYRAVFGLGAWVRAEFLLPRRWWVRMAPHVRQVGEYLDRAYAAVMGHEVEESASARLAALLADPRRVRIGLVGRSYLINDQVLSADLKHFFRRSGVAVVTPYDVPAAELAPFYDESAGYYDTHRLYEAFIRWAEDKLDGFVVVGSFGCHPDAFMNDYLADKIRRRGLPCWVFKYDEPVSQGGFTTRYQTILGFLEKRRDDRLQRAAEGGTGSVSAGVQPAAAGAVSAAQRPVIVWPDMGPAVNLPVMELLHQLGLEQYAWPPRPLDAEAMQLGNDLYTESCSPYAAATGTLKRSIMEAVEHFRAEAEKSGRPVEPLRFIVLMARGEGPCTFGWYAIAHKRHLAESLFPLLAPYGHTVSLVTAGLDGLGELLTEFARTGDARRIRAFNDYLEGSQKKWQGMSRRAVLGAKFRMWSTVARLYLCGWAKLGAVEDVRALAMTIRAHEIEAGATTRAYTQALRVLEQAHGWRAIRRARRAALGILSRVKVDHTWKPRVAAVGEIYVASASYANRGALENLFGREGIEVVPGTSVRDFVHHALVEMVRRAVQRQALVRRFVSWAKERGLGLFEPEARGREARPFAWHDVGGEGITSVAAARRLIEAGCSGIVHVYPFKCMPEGLVRGALAELASYYGVAYLGLSFDREHDIERLKTEIATFAAILRQEPPPGRWQVFCQHTVRVWRRRLAGAALSLAGGGPWPVTGRLPRKWAKNAIAAARQQENQR